MRKKYEVNTDENFVKFLGIQHPDNIAEEVEDLNPPKKDQELPQETLTKKKAKPVQSSPKMVSPSSSRKKGRPKVKRELKKRYTFTIFPSVYERAFVKAEEEGYSLSEVVSSLLEEYVGDE